MKNTASNKKFNQDVSLFVRAQQGDENACETILRQNERLVFSILSRYSFLGAAKEDLLQVAYMGMVKAIKRFDLSYGLQFSTYAVSVITGEIKTYFRNDGFVKVSRKLKGIYYKASLLRERSKKENGRDLSLDELAKQLDCDRYTVLCAFEACQPPCYLGQKLSNDEETCVGDVLEDKNFSFDAQIDKIVLSSILSSLDAQSRRIITFRYLLGKTQTQTAELLGISQVQVCRKEKKILEHIRQTFSPQ